MSDIVVRNKNSKNITSLSLDKNELRRLLDILQERTSSACEFENKKIDSDETEVYDKLLAKENLKKCSVLQVTITGLEDKVLLGTIDEVFNSVSFPERIKSVYVHSEIPYKSLLNYYPENFFEFFIDFSKPKVFDFSLQPSERTPNFSQIKVEGSDNTWVNGVFHEIDSEIKNKNSKFTTIHKGSIYDLLIWFIGLPFGFWVCYKFSSFITNAFIASPFLKSAFYVYLFFLSLFIIRILFHYFRWVFPMIEYRNKKENSIGHKILLGSLGLSILGSFIYDILRIFFNFKT